jgi:hypothetical protein
MPSSGERGMIIPSLVGSTVHSLELEGTDERDEMGICIDPPEYVPAGDVSGSRVLATR